MEMSEFHVEWVKTTHEVIAVLLASHPLGPAKESPWDVLSTHTCTQGCEVHVGMYIYTEWGWRGGAFPVWASLKKSETPKDHSTIEQTYWLAKIVSHEGSHDE